VVVDVTSNTPHINYIVAFGLQTNELPQV